MLATCVLVTGAAATIVVLDKWFKSYSCHRCNEELLEWERLHGRSLEDTEVMRLATEIKLQDDILKVMSERLNSQYKAITLLGEQLESAMQQTEAAINKLQKKAKPTKRTSK